MPEYRAQYHSSRPPAIAGTLTLLNAVKWSRAARASCDHVGVVEPVAAHAVSWEFDEVRATLDYYALGLELERLDGGVGALEFIRTKELIGRQLPPPPCTVADIGGGPGRYTSWLAALGYTVLHRDLSPLHVEQVAAARDERVDAAVADARQLDLVDGCADAVLLLGPMYHLRQRNDRLCALGEACRVVKPGAPVFVAAISRWAARIYGVLNDQLYRTVPGTLTELPRLERTGVIRPLFHGSFTGYGHRPRQLAAEVRAAGLEIIDLVAVEGPAALLNDLTERLRDPVDAEVVVDASRALERVPEVLGVGPHLLATARPPGAI